LSSAGLRKTVGFRLSRSNIAFNRTPGYASSFSVHVGGGRRLT
jgi:hypothetical protein